MTRVPGLPRGSWEVIEAKAGVARLTQLAPIAMWFCEHRIGPQMSAAVQPKYLIRLMLLEFAKRLADGH
jgi:hypothetical protein